MKAKLISLNSGAPHVIVLEKLPVVLGRGARADIHLSDRTLSRRHCEIDRVSATLVVRDLGSKNGTRVNRAHVSEAVLMPGDKLTLGGCTFVVCYDQHPSELPPLVNQRVVPLSNDELDDANTTKTGGAPYRPGDDLP